MTERSRAAGALARINKSRSSVFDRYCPERLNGCRPADIKDVLVIDSASRSGSSFLHYLISRHRNVISLNGEGSVFERLAGLGFAQSPDDSDYIAADAGVPPATLAKIAENMLLDAGLLHGEGAPGSFPRKAYLADCVQRLLLQYAEADLDADALHRVCSRELDRRSLDGASFSPAGYWRAVIESLHGAGFPVSRRHYDLRGSDPAADFPDAGNNTPPPFSSFALEDPPFIVPAPRALPARKDLEGKSLLLKASSDCYHMWMIRALFPNARLKFVTLARNPAGAVSGLIDGWHSDGFYSQNLAHITTLDIAGYSRAELPWTKRWWNFDLPPGWHAYRDRPIEEVCGHQWLSANEHILRDIEDKVVSDHLPVRYESFLEQRSLSEQLHRIFEFAGLGEGLPADGAMPPRVMSVTPPAPQKWRKRRDALAPLVSSGKIGAMARELGYDPGDWEKWP